ncbi:MAG: hypothetical protein CM15mP68_5380 [Pseudomonadota bacterium]|nr:MAG: hypothetical protein CM15mP68_5380 [Pseudomonadota bacterium]
MSLGSHRIFKRMVLHMSGVREGGQVLDLAGGTGDMAALFADAVGTNGRVVLADLNEDMMRVGRDRLLNRGLTQIEFCRTPAEACPLPMSSLTARVSASACVTSPTKIKRYGNCCGTQARCCVVSAGVFKTGRSFARWRLQSFSSPMAAYRSRLGWRCTALSILG